MNTTNPAPAWTPGPLTVERNSQDGEFYEIVTCDTVQRQGSPVEERLHLATVYSRADAELYAAAPEMVEFIQAIVKHCDSPLADCVNVENLGNRARAILAKIGGAS